MPKTKPFHFISKTANKASGLALRDARKRSRLIAQERENAELIALTERMEHCLDRMHETAQGVVSDLRAARQSLNGSEEIEEARRVLATSNPDERRSVTDLREAWNL